MSSFKYTIKNPESKWKVAEFIIVLIYFCYIIKSVNVSENIVRTKVAF